MPKTMQSKQYKKTGSVKSLPVLAETVGFEPTSPCGLPDFETHSPFVLWQNIDPLKRTCWNLGDVEYSRTILEFNPNYVLKSRNSSNFNVFE